MNYKEKLITQTVLCCMLFVSAKGLEFLPGEGAEAMRAAAMTQIEKNYTADDWKQFGKKLRKTAKEVPAVVTGVVLQANQDSNAEPVYAAADGTVLRSGIDPQHGMMVEIRHKNRVSTTGNLSSICKVQNETVKKGDLIGYYDPSCGKDLYYDIAEENFA